jgi:hypothetical protein
MKRVKKFPTLLALLAALASPIACTAKKFSRDQMED